MKKAVQKAAAPEASSTKATTGKAITTKVTTELPQGFRTRMTCHELGKNR